MSHYFVTPEGPEGRKTVQLRIWGNEHSFITASGVFSADRLDLGTSVLLRTCGPPEYPEAAAPRLLDLGCGWGPIAVALAVACPGAVVDAVDSNARAVALTKENAIAAGVGASVNAVLPEALDPSAQYDEIWSNPPIRIGKEPLHSLLLQHLSKLKPHGHANLVVARNLGADSLHTWLESVGYRVQRLASAKGYRVLRVDTA
jgi:16S rRNA G1207 methylase RsmC